MLNDSKRSHINPDTDELPAIHTPPILWNQDELESKRQEWFECMSGPGERYFDSISDPDTSPEHPAISSEKKTKFSDPPNEHVLSAPQVHITIHRTSDDIDLLELLLLLNKYFESTKDVKEVRMLHNELLINDSSNHPHLVDVRVYNDTSTNIVICIY
jgi:hypothetical protein